MNGALRPLTPDDPEKPLLVVGSSLGIAVAELWREVLPLVEEHVGVVGYDLPGHGDATGPVRQPLTVGAMADEVAGWLDEHAKDRRAVYAGVSLGGAIGLHLALRHPDVVRAVAVICSADYLGASDAWHDRAALVRAEGTSPLREGSRQRWFDPGFASRSPETVERLVDGLGTVRPEGYAACCDALAGYDLRGELAPVQVPVLVVGGASDAVAPPAAVRETAAAVRHGEALVLPSVGHQAPAEAPQDTAEAVLALVRSV